MGLYDILSKYNLDYNTLANLVLDLRGCVDFNAAKIIRQLDDLYDEAEYRRDFPKQPKRVYMVRQTQPCDGYDQFTIAVFDNKEQAVALARKLNKEYAVGVLLSDEGDFITQDDEFCDWDNCHYYEIGWCDLNNDEPYQQEVK